MSHDLEGYLVEQFATLLNEPGFTGAAAGRPPGQTSNAAWLENAKSGPCTYPHIRWCGAAVSVKNCILCLDRMAYWLGLRTDQMPKSCEEIDL